MAWYWITAGKQGTHHGVLDNGTIRADCGSAYAATAAVLLNLQPGEWPADPEQICSECRLRRERTMR